jgi:hypothetical protein
LIWRCVTCRLFSNCMCLCCCKVWHVVQTVKQSSSTRLSVYGNRTTLLGKTGPKNSQILEDSSNQTLCFTWTYLISSI